MTLRDQHCQWAGGCTQPAGACQVHHTKHKADGGETSAKDCVLLCPFHHQIVIHRWGWTLVVNPDGTTSAWNKNKTGTKPRPCTATDHPPAPGKGPAWPAQVIDRDQASRLSCIRVSWNCARCKAVRQLAASFWIAGA